jgi:hypothetical protein
MGPAGESLKLLAEKRISLIGRCQNGVTRKRLNKIIKKIGGKEYRGTIDIKNEQPTEEELPTDVARLSTASRRKSQKEDDEKIGYLENNGVVSHDPSWLRNLEKTKTSAKTSKTSTSTGWTQGSIIIPSRQITSPPPHPLDDATGRATGDCGHLDSLVRSSYSHDTIIPDSLSSISTGESLHKVVQYPRVPSTWITSPSIPKRARSVEVRVLRNVSSYLNYPVAWPE